MTPLANLQTFLDHKLSVRDDIQILEAGCGSNCRLKFNHNSRKTGIDNSLKQLERNNIMDHKILGDIQSYNLEPLSYDAVICWNVLEHLEKPVSALDRMINSLKHNGLLVLRLPNVLSLKGLVTKFSPYWFHILYYKYVCKKKNAGVDDAGPFKTFLKYSIAPNSLKRYATKKKLNVVFYQYFDVGNNPNQFNKSRLGLVLRKVYNLFRTFFRIISLGLIRESELMIVFWKN